LALNDHADDDIPPALGAPAALQPLLLSLPQCRYTFLKQHNDNGNSSLDIAIEKYFLPGGACP
jgi:hypothetical protein